MRTQQLANTTFNYRGPRGNETYMRIKINARNIQMRDKWIKRKPVGLPYIDAQLMFGGGLCK